MTPRAWLIPLAAAVLFGLPTAAAAQLPVPAAQPSPEAEVPQEPPPPAFVPVPEVAIRSEELRDTLRGTEERLAKPPEVAAIEAGLPDVRSEIRELRVATTSLLEGSPTLQQIADAERGWQRVEARLDVWRESLAQRATTLEEELEALDERRELWRETRTLARESAAPPTVLSTVAENLEAIAATRKLVSSARSELLSLLDAVGQEELGGSDALADLSSRRAEIRARLFEPDGRPLWAVLSSSSSLSSLPGRVGERVRAEIEAVRTLFADRGPGPVGATFVAVALVALFVRGRMRRRQPTGELAGSAMVFERPYSIAAICAFGAGVVAFPFAPSIVTEVIGGLIVIPALRVVAPLVHPAFRPSLHVLAGLYVVDRLRDFIAAIELLERSLFLVETAAGALFILWLLRPSRLRELPQDGERPPEALPPFLWTAAALLLVSTIANVLGYVTLSSLLGNGVLRTAYLSVLLYSVYRIALTLLLVGFTSTRAQRGRIIPVHGPVLLRWSRIVLVGGLLLYWARNVFDFFALLDPVRGGLTTALTAPLTLGTISLSLGDVLAFFATIAVAVALSRVLRVLLSDEFLPRLSLRRGVAHAVSTTAQYVVLLGGFFLALGAANVDFSRFTLLAGAFGVGIGFGLQNVVNNFVSGLILLYERPIQLGDTVEVGGLLGDVRRIGIRASTIRTFQGAEVIVPNGNLISAEVVNWTLSDHHRRVELPVGVAYGNRPRDVIEILERIVNEEPGLLRDPRPLVLFRGFGDSSLDFEVRFWAPDYNTSLRLSSDVACAIHDALHEAGIEIPFPQRDLHLKTIEPDAAERLGQRDER